MAAAYEKVHILWRLLNNSYLFIKEVTFIYQILIVFCLTWVSLHGVPELNRILLRLIVHRFIHAFCTCVLIIIRLYNIQITDFHAKNRTIIDGVMNYLKSTLILLRNWINLVLQIVWSYFELYEYILNNSGYEINSKELDYFIGIYSSGARTLHRQL